MQRNYYLWLKDCFRRLFYRIWRIIFLFILKAFFGFEVKGREHLLVEGGFILASNHVSFLDPAALGCACPYPLNYMARHDLFKVPFLSQWMRSVGVFPVKRESADLSAIKEAIHRVKRGGALGLFPEGTRQADGRISENPEAGVGFLAAKLDVPVIPAFIKGTDQALPRGAKFLRPAKIIVHFGSPVRINKKMPYQDIARLIMKEIRHLAF